MYRWKTRKIEVVNKMGGCCSKCGYNKSMSALEFHHLDKNSKEYEWSKMRMLSENKLKKELSKCILVCANCHREIHESDL
jgi:formate-dependent nitrite reductase cytochrome c552 subunit